MAKKRGRPRAGPNGTRAADQAPFSVRLDDNVRDTLKEIAHQRGVTMSELLAEAAALLMARLPVKSRGAVKDFLKRRP